MYDATPRKSAHHRVANEMLGHGTELRAAVLSFANGAPLRACLHLFRKVFLLKCIPIVERLVEQLHSVIKSSLGSKRRRHPTTVSLANRGAEIERRLAAWPVFLNQLADALGKTRNARLVCEVCRFLAHPSIRPLHECGRHVTHWFTAAVKLFYHLELGLQFPDVATQRRAHDKKKTEDKKEQALLHKLAPKPGSMAGVLQDMQFEHMVQLVSSEAPGSVLEVPLGEGDKVFELYDYGSVSRSVPGGFGVQSVSLFKRGVPSEGHTSDIERDDGGPVEEARAQVEERQLVESRLGDQPKSVLLKIVHTKAGSTRTMPLSPAMPKKLIHSDMLVTVHVRIKVGGQTLISKRPMQLSNGQSLAVMSRFHQARDILDSETEIFQQGEIKYLIDGAPADSACVDAISRLAGESAFGLNSESVFIPVLSSTMALIMALKRLQILGCPAVAISSK